MRKPLLFASIVVAVGAACSSGSSSIDPEKYDRACKSANDCVLIATDACCACPSAAINVSAQTQYNADFANARKNCTGLCPGAHCESYAAGCSGGVCVVTQPLADAGTD
jgi:hypothetical protein